MKQLRISSPLTLHVHSTENISEYIKAGLRFHKEAGFDAADIGMRLFPIDSDAWAPYVEQAIAASQEIGVKIEICHLLFINGGGPKSEEFMRDFEQRMHRAIDAAALLGVDYAVLHPNATTLPLKTYDRQGQYDMVMAHLAPFAEHAARVGLNIVVENMRVIPTFRVGHRFCQTPEELCDIADALGIGVCWDFGHANISGIKQSEGLAYVGKRLKVVHVNDNTGVDDDHILPFTGNIDWRDAMHGLALAEFDGLLNYEFRVGGIPASVRKALAGYMISAAHELMTYIE